jgi:hypothetical protein
MSIYQNSSRQSGSVLIEFALIAPILILLIAGVIQFGFILNAKIAVNSASYEGARAATLAKDPSRGALEAVQKYASSTMPGWDYSDRLKAEIDIQGTDPGDLVSVKVVYDIPVFFPKILPVGNSETFCVSGSSVMQIEEKE